MIQDKVVVITGASSGIGEATAKKLIEKGAKVVLAARREDKLEDIKTSYPELEVSYVKTDVTKLEDVQRLVDFTMEKYGKIDVLFNNAGIMPLSPLVEGRTNEWKAMLDINVMGVLNGLATVLPIMSKQKCGHIISTDSVAGHVVYPNSAVYCGTKFMIRAVMEGLRQEHRTDGIKSTIISPGNVKTELLNTISDQNIREGLYKWSDEIQGLTPDQVADAVIFVIDTEANMSVSDIIIRPTRQEV